MTYKEKKELLEQMKTIRGHYSQTGQYLKADNMGYKINQLRKRINKDRLEYFKKR